MTSLIDFSTIVNKSQAGYMLGAKSIRAMLHYATGFDLYSVLEVSELFYIININNGPVCYIYSSEFR